MAFDSFMGVYVPLYHDCEINQSQGTVYWEVSSIMQDDCRVYFQFLWLFLLYTVYLLLFITN